MRIVLPALAILVLAAPALALPPPETPSCVPSCEIPSTTLGFLPPVTLLASGTTLRWTAVDGEAHTASDPAQFCFHSTYGEEAGVATFRIAEGILYAKSPDRLEKACGAAETLPDGSFRLRYVCVYHPMMVGEIVVRPTESQVA